MGAGANWMASDSNDGGIARDRHAPPPALPARLGPDGMRREAEVRALCGRLAERFGECGLGCLSVDPQAKAIVGELARLGATRAELWEASSTPPCATAIVAIAVQARENGMARAPSAAGAVAAGAEAKIALPEGCAGCGCGRVRTRRG